MNALQNFFLMLIGPDGNATELTLLHVALRGLIIFLVGLAIVRIGDRRSLAEKTGFDAIFIVLIGSMLSRAINGPAPFFTTIGAGIALMIVHRAFAFGAFKSHAFGKLIKGNAYTLVRKGEVDWKEMKRGFVSQHDLEEDLHLDAKTEDISDIETARLERSGDISFIKKKQTSN
jgi:uncharacterized membrane protein YcaP (DUF421 family)